jgi:hypothetical protein
MWARSDNDAHTLPCHTVRSMKRFYVVASVPLLLAALIPIAASLYLAQRKAQDDQIAYLMKGVEINQPKTSR